MIKKTMNEIKGVLGGLGLAGLISWLGISWESLTIFAIILVLDFILGVADAYLLNREQVKSSIATRWVFKKVSKLLLPIIVVIVLKWAGFTNTAPIINSIMWILIFAEGYSIVGHIYCINTGKSLPEIDAFELVIKKIVEIMKPKLEPKNKPE